MKKIIYMVLFSLTTLGYSQDIYTQNNTDVFDKEAQRITNAYNKQLALDADQFLLFEQKVEEFLITRSKIESNYKGKEKLIKLFNMQQKETAEMGDILTRPQLELYKQIKSEIQPLDVVESD
ncbi:hypothetical protein [Olleya aquimaris]|uniref:Uncharacterized protein n=1 Tax=Olleya aquimaris TaxID=639310 RepID=A0A327R7K5_9FLAO|nr:hypothetical protein [Olleya aquimaris]RAJ11932.1 hypothetical protein LY08_02432 [Olleya aquimaris]